MSSAVINPVEELLSSPIPDKLWHYSSIGGFQGIVSSKKIFATDLRYLNDHEEFEHALKVVDQLIDEMPEKDGSGWEQKRNVRETLTRMSTNGVLSPQRTQVYVASFSSAEDQLSQWRGYSRGNSGASLGFRFENIRPAPGIGTLVNFAPCVYDDGEKRRLISHVLDRFSAEASDVWKQLGDADALQRQADLLRQADPGLDNLSAIQKVFEEKKTWVDETLLKMAVEMSADLLRLAALMKHSSFSEEREWRLVLPIPTQSEPKANPRRFRVGSTTLVPYVEFPLPDAGGYSLSLCDLILGPGSEPVISVEAAKTFLRSNNIKVDPRMSKSTFRSW